jgi:hypothetical protein
MKVRINRFSIHQTSKVIALLSVIFGLLAIPIGIGIYLDYPERNLGLAILFWLMPLWNGALGYFATALACWLYNALADKVGGIELEADKLRPSRTPMTRIALTATRITTVDPKETICSNCRTKQWSGHSECELCGARFEKS